MTLSLARFFSRLLTRKPAPTPEIDWRDKMRDSTGHLGLQPSAEIADRNWRATREFDREQERMRVEMENELDAAGKRPTTFSRKRWYEDKRRTGGEG